MARLLKLFIILLFIVNISSAQILYQNTGYIPQQYQIEWNKAGLLSNDTHIAANTYNVNNYGAVPNDGNNDYSAIISAINAAKDHEQLAIVYFPQGTYDIHSQINLPVGYDNIVFKGSGMSTILKFKVGKNNICFNVYGSESSNAISINSGITKGDYTISLDPTTLEAGDWVHYYELNYPIEDVSTYSTSIGQISRIEEINSNEIVLLEPASKIYSTSYGPYLNKVSPIKNIGFENFQLLRDEGSKADNSGNGSNISFRYAVNCWVKGVESNNTSRYHIRIDYSAHLEISGCYIHGTESFDDGGYGYGVLLHRSSNFNLIENNIFKSLRHSIVLQAGGNSNVIIYNYSTDVHGENWLFDYGIPDITLHGNYPFANLFEHNFAGLLAADEAHGKNGLYNVFFRNRSKFENQSSNFYMVLSDCPYTAVEGLEITPHGWSPAAPQGGIYWYGITNITLNLYGKFSDNSNRTHKQVYEDNNRSYCRNEDISYYYSTTPDFITSVFTFPSIGPKTSSNGSLTSQNIPARARATSSSTENTYNPDPTIPSYSIDVIVDQKNSAGSSFGSVNVWESNSWISNNAPHTYSWYIYSDHVIKSKEDVYASEKFNNWDDNVILNYNKFNIYPDQNNITSNFTGIESATIETKLGNSNNGNIKLKDPWLRDYNEAPYGIRNQGMSAPFISYSSPHNVTTSSTHKGVFLNQGYDEATNTWNSPYYSVKAQTSQNFIAHGETVKGYFQYWGGSNVQFQHPGSYETAVVFKNSGASARAMYKGHFASDKSNAYSSNSQRKLIQTNDGKYHTVYVDDYYYNGSLVPSVYYSKSTSGSFSGSWTDETVYDHLAAINAANPSIDYYGNHIYGVYELKDGNNTKIIYSDEYVDPYCTVATVSGNFGNCKPVIAVTKSGSYLYIYIAWKPGAYSRPKYSILKKTVTGSSFQTIDDEIYIPNTTSSSKNITIAAEKTGNHYVHLAWENSSKIKYQRIESYDLFKEYKTISSGGGGYKNHYPSISLHEESDPIVTWTDDDEEETVIRYNDDRGDYYEWKTFYFCGNNSEISNVNSDRDKSSVIAFRQWDYNNQLNGKNYYVKMDGDGYHSPQLISNPGKYIQVSNGDDLSDVRIINYKIYSSLPHLLQKSSFSIYKAADSDDFTAMRRGVIVKGDVEFVFDISDVMLNGENILFKEFSDTLAITNFKTLHDLNTATRTENMCLDKSSELFFSHKYYVVNKEHADTTLKENDAVKFKVELVRSSDDYVCGVVKEMVYNKNNVDAFESKDFKLDCSGLKADKYYLRLKTEVKGDAEYFMGNGVNGSETLAKKDYEDLEVAGVSMPLTYELAQNYPNPFNPVTTISYAVPNAGIVEITIYDIRGRIVKTLLDTYKEPGRYTVRFDGKQLSSGLYIYRLKSGDFITQRKMLLVK